VLGRERQQRAVDILRLPPQLAAGGEIEGDQNTRRLLDGWRRLLTAAAPTIRFGLWAVDQIDAAGADSNGVVANRVHGAIGPSRLARLGIQGEERSRFREQLAHVG